ncbi:MAG: hypothetical protein ABJE10_01765 [bacterium]
MTAVAITATPSRVLAEGLEPLLAPYPLRLVLVGSKATFDDAEYLTRRPRPLLAPRVQFDGGTAFTVLPR